MDSKPSADFIASYMPTSKQADRSFICILHAYNIRSIVVMSNACMKWRGFSQPQGQAEPQESGGVKLAHFGLHVCTIYVIDT